MRYRTLVVTVLAAVLVVSACRTEEPPPPAPTGPSADQLAAEEAARVAAAAAAAEEARLAAEAEAERARLARERAALEAARTTLTERVHFDYDMAEIRPDAERMLREKLSILRASPDVRLRIEGHCDERGSNEYNDALGNRRAQAVVEFFTASGIDDGRFSIVSFGEDRPLRNQSNEGSWSQNRRAEFIITGGEVNVGRTP